MCVGGGGGAVSDQGLHLMEREMEEDRAMITSVPDPLVQQLT